MPGTTIKKIDSKYSPAGHQGPKYLVSGKSMSMRLWELEQPGDKDTVKRDYETIGYVLSGKAELTIEGQRVKLEPGDSWLVPAHSAHTYKIIESFTAIEATAPPAEIHGRDR